MAAAPNLSMIGGLDYNGNPTLKPFSDGARVDIAAAQIDRLEMRINDTFLITLFQIINDRVRSHINDPVISHTVILC
jgi:hypothetical protein